MSFERIFGRRKIKVSENEYLLFEFKMSEGNKWVDISFVKEDKSIFICSMSIQDYYAKDVFISENKLIKKRN